MGRPNLLKRWGVFGLVLGALALSATGASAQWRRGGMMGRSGGLQMLQTPEVQKELKMTPEQIGKLDAKQQEVRQGMQGLFQGGFMQSSPAERQQAMDKMQDLQDKAAADILDPTQVKRFHQLELQQQGPVAILHKSVGTELKLTDDQQKKAADIQAQADTDMRAALQGVDFQSMTDADRTKMAAKMQASQKAEGDKLQALLTDAQKAQWKDMQGAPFAFPGAGGPAAATPTPAAPAAATSSTPAPASTP